MCAQLSETLEKYVSNNLFEVVKEVHCHYDSYLDILFN